MTPWLDDGDLQLYHGDAARVLADLPAESVQCVVCSPPYWGLRDYQTGEWVGGDPGCDHLEPRHPNAKDMGLNARMGRASGERHQETAKQHQYRGRCERCGAERVDQQIGLEDSLEAYIDALRDVFGSLWHVLRSDGVVWLNLGDSYARPVEKGIRGPSLKQDSNVGTPQAMMTDVPAGLKPKDLVGIPWRVAFALQADGWYLRSAVVWDKPNPMPESVTDRPTSSYEMVFMLTKSARYYYDQEAVRERYEARPQRRHTPMHDQPKAAARAEAGVAQGNPQGGAHASPYDVQAETLGDLPPDGPRGPDGRRVTTRTTGPLSHENYGELSHQDGRERWPNGGRNMRNVWRIPTQPTAEAHFATYPEELVRRCIMAATSEAGECSACGTPWRRETTPGRLDETRPQARRALELFRDAGLTDAHADAIRSVGIADTGKALVTTNGAGHNTAEVQALADEAREALGGYYREFLLARPATTGWVPGCECDAPAVPQRVLDPFIGSGTTALVARRLGRHAIGIDLNESYLQIAADRTRQLSLLG